MRFAVKKECAVFIFFSSRELRCRFAVAMNQSASGFSSLDDNLLLLVRLSSLRRRSIEFTLSVRSGSPHSIAGVLFRVSFFWGGAGFQCYPLLRILRDAVHVNDPVQMRAVGAAGRADVADHVAFLYVIAGLYI